VFALARPGVQLAVVLNEPKLQCGEKKWAVGGVDACRDERAFKRSVIKPSQDLRSDKL
jgi:hypothetical protein